METVPVDPMDVQRAQDLVLNTAFSYMGEKFEEHFLSNTGIYVHVNRVLTLCQFMSYSNAPGGDEDLGGGLVRKARRFNWDISILDVPEEMNLDHELVHVLSRYAGGNTLGYIASSQAREDQMLSLGSVVEKEFCREITILDYTINLYSAPNRPTYTVIDRPVDEPVH